MPRSDADCPEFDWRGWLSLAWMVGFGLLYALMILKEKAPGLLARISGSH